LVSSLIRERGLDETITVSWSASDGDRDFLSDTRTFDIVSIYTRFTQNHERATLLAHAGRVQQPLQKKETVIEQALPPAEILPRARHDAETQTQVLLGLWPRLPRRVREPLWLHLRHYLHATLSVSWLLDTSPRTSALLSLSWSHQTMPPSLTDVTDILPPGSPTVPTPLNPPGRLEPEIADAAAKLLARLQKAIAELGYATFLEDSLSPDLMGGEDSLLGTDSVMVVPGHQPDSSQPILLALTTGWNGKGALSFTKVFRQVKTRLIEARGAVKLVVVLCDTWQSPTFDDDQREELGAHFRNGVKFLFLLVGVPDRGLVPVPVSFDESPA
jgi:hypothetical protein